MNIYIRTDSALNIGSGHVMRCLNLADGLSEKEGSKITFICKNHEGNLGELIKQRGYHLELMDNTYEPSLDIKTWLGSEWQDDANETSKIIKSIESNIINSSESQIIKSTESQKKNQRLTDQPIWLIIDHYNIYRNWEEILIQQISDLRILVIDDYYDREHLANIVLNQMYHKNNQKLVDRYLKLIKSSNNNDNKISVNPVFLIGTKYCLLNPKIKGYKKKPEKIPKKPGKIGRTKILLTLGGNDPENVTLEVIKTLTEVELNVDIEIIIGNSNPHHLAIEEYLAIYKSKSDSESIINLHRGLKQEAVFKILKECDFAIGAIGVSMYERLCIGLPSMVVNIAENQVSICEEMNDLIMDLGFGLSFDKGKLIEMVDEWSKNKTKLDKTREHYQSICDGEGVSRIVSTIFEGQ